MTYEDKDFVPDINLAKAIFQKGGNTNNYGAQNSGARVVNSATNMRYGTVVEDTDGSGKVKVLLDGSTDPIIVDCSETLEKGSRVCVISMGGSYKALSMIGDTIGGDMIKFDAVFANKIVADEAFIQKLVASDAFINNLTANVAYIEKLTANDAFINKLTSNNAFINELISNKIFVEDLEAKYVLADKANIDQAWINDLFVKSSFVAQEGNIFNLTGLHIDANDITTGVLTVDRLVVQGPDGEYYLLEPDGTGQFDQTKLDGNIIKQNSLHADRITANSITTEQITTNNLVGTGGWINLADGTFAYGNPNKDESDKYIGNFITWDGNKLKLNVDELNIASTSFDDKMEVLETQITQNANNVTIAVTEAQKAVNVANSADSTLSNLLNTNFIFTSSGLKITSNNGAYYTLIGSDAFSILRTSNDRGIRIYNEFDDSSNFYRSVIETSDHSNEELCLRTNSGLLYAIIRDNSMVISASDTAGLMRQNPWFDNYGSYHAWFPVYSGSTTGSVTFNTTVPSDAKLLILYDNGSANGWKSMSSAIYDLNRGNGYINLNSTYIHAGTGICNETKRLRVTTSGLTVNNGGRDYVASGNGKTVDCNISSTSLFNILGVYALVH